MERTAVLIKSTVVTLKRVIGTNLLELPVRTLAVVMHPPTVTK